MATIDRFKEPLKKGGIAIDGRLIPLTSQMKYDYMAAVHTMEQLLDLAAAIDKNNKKRADLRTKISNSCKISLRKIVESEDIITLQQLEAAIHGLQECRKELVKLEIADKETAKLSEYIKDGISAGR
jgi:hypothetical protein